MEAFQAVTVKYADLFDEDKADRMWYDTLEKVDRFLSDNGKRPQPSQHAKDPEEKRLGSWLTGRLMDSRKGKLVADRMEAFQTLTTKYADLLDEDKLDKIWYDTL
jgi:hypothetical protein